VLIGFKGELLHVFNKNEHSIHKSDYFEKIRHRDSVILLGDSLGDLRITEGAQNCTNLLKIGFLNDKVSDLVNLIRYLIFFNDKVSDLHK